LLRRVWLARTLAESNPLGNGRIGLGAADLMFRARSPQARRWRRRARKASHWQ